MKQEVDNGEIEKISTITMLKHFCPISLERFCHHTRNFDINIETSFDFEVARKDLIRARMDLDLLVSSILQSLYDSSAIRKTSDKIQLEKLETKMEMLTRGLNKAEDALVTTEMYNEEKKITFAQLHIYTRKLKSVRNVFVESLIASTKEYYRFEETEKIKKEPRTFLYILFSILDISLPTVSTSDSKVDTPKNIYQKGAFSVPMSWQGSMSKKGQELIKDKYISNDSKSPQDEVSKIEKAEESMFSQFGDEDENVQ